MEKKSGNSHLKKASSAKKDEFYTQLSDIERELGHYKEHFQGKTIFCNCDDPEESNFYFYFAQNFEFLGLKKLITTHYKIDKPSYKLEIISDINHDGKINKLDTVKTLLKQNGDFRSPECIEILKEADIVVTNPPFSLFREYVADLIKYNKKFIIIGHQNAITYKEIFKLIKENKIWLGYGFKGGAAHFINRHYTDYATAGNHKDGMIRVSGVNWFTNLEIQKRHEDLVLFKSYCGNELEYPKYDNYDAINVDITKNIPMDYSGAIGVPITFMDKYNPEQFEILALGNSRDNFTPNKDYINPKKVMKDNSKASGNAINCVLAIETNVKPSGKIYYISDNSNYLIAPYARIIIKNKKL